MILGELRLDSVSWQDCGKEHVKVVADVLVREGAWKVARG